MPRAKMPRRSLTSGKALVSLLAAALGTTLVLSLGQCFSPTLPACSYQCTIDSPNCPDDYECRGDGLCHLKGNNDVCPFDLSSAADMSRASTDMGGGDMHASDAGRD